LGHGASPCKLDNGPGWHYTNHGQVVHIVVNVRVFGSSRAIEGDQRNGTVQRRMRTYPNRPDLTTRRPREFYVGRKQMSKKGYWVAMVDIADQEGYKDYIALNKAAFDKYGASFVVRAGQESGHGGSCQRTGWLSSSSRTTRRRSPATTLPNIRRRSRPARSTPRYIWPWWKASDGGGFA
jgi:hypothetical protein